MPYCPNCGYQFSEGMKFCPECGQSVQRNQSTPFNKTLYGSITFFRLPCSVAKYVGTRIIVDGTLYGEIQENEQLVVALPFGIHSVTIRCALNPPLLEKVNVDSTNSVGFTFVISETGQPVRASESYVNTDDIPSSKRQNIREKREKPRKKRRGLAVIVIALLVCLVIYMLNNGSPSSGSNSSSIKTVNSVSAITEKPKGIEKNDHAPANTLLPTEFDLSKYHQFDYSDIARKPDSYKGELITFSGRVIQVIESTLFGTTTVTLRVNEDNDYDKTWYVTYTRKDSTEDRILEDDIITLYGTCNGVETYTSVFGAQVTIPSMSAENIELGKNINGVLMVFNAEEVIEKLKTNEFSYLGTWSHYHFIEIENTSVFDVDLTIKVKYYDEDNGLIGIGSMSGNIQAGGTALLCDMPDDEYATTILEYEVKECSYTTPMQSELSCEVIKKSDKLIVSVTNTSEVAAQFVEAQVLFYNGDRLVDYSSTYIMDSDCEIKAGKECTEEINFYAYGETFDNYRIYISGMKK